MKNSLIGGLGENDAQDAHPTIVSLDKVTDVTFLIIGNGELATELKELAHDLQIQEMAISFGRRGDMPVIIRVLHIRGEYCSVVPLWRQLAGQSHAATHE